MAVNSPPVPVVHTQIACASQVGEVSQFENRMVYVHNAHKPPPFL
jgi:hypothetical protein